MLHALRLKLSNIHACIRACLVQRCRYAAKGKVCRLPGGSGRPGWLGVCAVDVQVACKIGQHKVDNVSLLSGLLMNAIGEGALRLVFGLRLCMASCPMSM